MLLIGSGGSTVCTGKKFSLAEQKQFPTYKLVILRNSFVSWLFATWNVFSFIMVVRPPDQIEKIIKPTV